MEMSNIFAIPTKIWDKLIQMEKDCQYYVENEFVERFVVEDGNYYPHTYPLLTDENDVFVKENGSYVPLLKWDFSGEFLYIRDIKQLFIAFGPWMFPKATKSESIRRQFEDWGFD